MAQTAFPMRDGSGGKADFSLVGHTSNAIYTVLNEADANGDGHNSKATKSLSGAGQTFSWVKLGTALSDPGNEGHLIYVVASASGSGTAHKLWVDLSQGTAGGTHIAALPNFHPNANWTVHTAWVSAASAANITDYDDLWFRIEGTGTSKNKTVAITKAVLQLPDAASENTISGNITDYFRDLPVQGALITVTTANGSATDNSDANGDYSVAIGASSQGVVVTCDYFDWCSSPSSFREGQIQANLTGKDFMIGPASDWPNAATPYAFRARLLFPTSNGTINSGKVWEFPFKTGNQTTFSREAQHGEGAVDCKLFYHEGKTFVTYRGSRPELENPTFQPKYDANGNLQWSQISGLLQIYDHLSNTFLSTPIVLAAPDMGLPWDTLDSHYFVKATVNKQSGYLNELVSPHGSGTNAYWMEAPDAVNMKYYDGWLFKKQVYSGYAAYEVDSGLSNAVHTAQVIKSCTYGRMVQDSAGRPYVVGRSDLSDDTRDGTTVRINLRRAPSGTTWYNYDILGGTHTLLRSSADWAFTHKVSTAGTFDDIYLGAPFINSPIVDSWNPTAYNAGFEIDKFGNLHYALSVFYVWSENSFKQVAQGIIYLYSPQSQVSGISTPEAGHYWYSLQGDLMAIVTDNTTQPFVWLGHATSNYWAATAWSTPQSMGNPSNFDHYFSNLDSLVVHPDKLYTTPRGDIMQVPYFSFFLYDSAMLGSADYMFLCYATPSHSRANVNGWVTRNVSTAVATNGYDTAYVWEKRYGGYLNIDNDGVIRMWGSVKNNLSSASSWSAAGLRQWESKDDEVTWDIETIDDRGEYGIPLYIFKKDYSNNQIEAVRTRGFDVDYLNFSTNYAKIQNDGEDFAVFYQGQEIDRVSSFWNYASSRVYFKIQKTLTSAYAFDTAGNYYFYYGHASANVTPKRNPQNIWGIFESWEAYEHKEIPIASVQDGSNRGDLSNVNWVLHTTGSIANAYYDYRVSAGLRKSWLAFSTDIDGLAHPTLRTNRGENSLFIDHGTVAGVEFLHTTLPASYKTDISYQLSYLQSNGGTNSKFYVGFIYGDTAVCIGKVTGFTGYGIYHGDTASNGLDNATAWVDKTSGVTLPTEPWKGTGFRDLTLIVTSVSATESLFTAYQENHPITDPIVLSRKNMDKIIFGVAGGGSGVGNHSQYYIDQVRVSKK